MDVGIFKASRTRMLLWIIVPPLVIISVGLSSYAMKQRSEWQLKETRGLSNVLPEVMLARKEVQDLFESIGLSEDKQITTGDQLIALLEEKARNRSVDLKRTQIMAQDERARKSKIPLISVMMDASGDIAEFQLFMNDVKSAYPLVSPRSIVVEEAREEDDAEFNLKVVFDLLLVDDVLKASGGSR